MSYPRGVPPATPVEEIIFRRAVSVVAKTKGVRVTEVLGPRGRECRRARLLAAYVAVTRGNLQISKVAGLIGLRHSGVQRALQRIEERRDDPAFEQELSKLEGRFNGRAA